MSRPERGVRDSLRGSANLGGYAHRFERARKGTRSGQHHHGTHRHRRVHGPGRAGATPSQARTAVRAAVGRRRRAPATRGHRHRCADRAQPHAGARRALGCAATLPGGGPARRRARQHRCGGGAGRVRVAGGANAPSVAEYVIAAALLLLRGAYGATAALASGHWPRAALSNGREFAGKTLALVGFGAIGQLTARSAAALGVRTMACDALLGADHPAFAQTGTQPVGLDELVAQADVVSLHVPLLATTRGLFDADRIGKMKPGAVLINSARGGIVDQAAVAAA